MILVRNIFSSLIIGSFAACLMLPGVALAERDYSVDCAGRPRWDRFVVDEGATNWDPSTAECFGEVKNGADNDKLMYGAPAMYGDSASSSSPRTATDKRLYGAPAMYGELEGNVGNKNNYHKMYGTPDSFDARALYGKYDPSLNKPRPKPILAPLPVAKSSVQKYPTNIKPTVQKSSYNKKPAVPAKVSEPKPIQALAAPVVAQVAPTPPLPPTVIVPDKNARNIANNLNYKFDIDSYCQQINPPVLGPLPGGLVLMPGRPDLMSCVTK